MNRSAAMNKRKGRAASVCVLMSLGHLMSYLYRLYQVTSLLESANPRANETNKRVNEIKACVECRLSRVRNSLGFEEWCAGRRIPRHLRSPLGLTQEVNRGEIRHLFFQHVLAGSSLHGHFKSNVEITGWRFESTPSMCFRRSLFSMKLWPQRF